MVSLYKAGIPHSTSARVATLHHLCIRNYISTLLSKWELYNKVKARSIEEVQQSNGEEVGGASGVAGTRAVNSA